MRDGSRLENRGGLHPDSKYSLGVRTVVVDVIQLTHNLWGSTHITGWMETDRV